MLHWNDIGLSFKKSVGEAEGNRTGQDYTWHWTGHQGRFLGRFLMSSRRLLEKQLMHEGATQQ